jgi:hypothetical protein
MALIFCDGYGFYNTPSQKWSNTTGYETIGPGVIGPRTGPNCLIIGTPGAGPTIVFAPRTELIAGTAFVPNSFASVPGLARVYNFQVNDISDVSIQIFVFEDLSIHVLNNGNNDLGGTVPGLCLAGGYNYIETHVRFDRLVGFVIVRLNGIVVLSLTGIDTVGYPGNAFASGFQLMGVGTVSANPPSQHADTYLLDPLVAPNTTFLGAVRIYSALQVPFADASPLQWTPSVAGAHYPLVNTVPPDLTKYVESNTPGQVDEYLHSIAGIPPGSLVLGVQHALLACLDTAGSHSIGSSIDEITGPVSTSLSVTAHMALQPYDVDPVTGVQWVLGDIPTRRIGPVVTA